MQQMPLIRQQQASSIQRRNPAQNTEKIRHGIRGASTFHTGDRLMKPPEFSESGPYFGRIDERRATCRRSNTPKIFHDRLLRAVSYHHQFRFDRQRGFTDIEFRGLPVLRAGSDRLKLPVRGNSRLGIPDEPTAVTLFQSDDADILNVLQQYGKPLVAPFRGLTAHQLHHLLFQLHARKALGGDITAEKVVYGIALGRGQPRKEQYQNQQ